MVELERALVHPVGPKPFAGIGKRPGDTDLGHAERRERHRWIQSEAFARLEELPEGDRIDRFCAVQQHTHVGQVQGLLTTPEGARCERVGEVGSGGCRGLEVRQPTHPTQRTGEEVLRGTLDQIGTPGHRDGEQADESHVVVERQPRHDPVVLGDLCRFPRAVEVGADVGVRQHHTLGFRGRTRSELQDCDRIGIRLRSLVVVAAGAGGSTELIERQEGRVALDALDERDQFGIDKDHRRIGAVDPVAGLLDELFECSHPHGKGHGDESGARDPDRLYGGDEFSGRGAQQGDVIAGAHPPGLEAGGGSTCLHVKVGPGDRLVVVARDEGDCAPGILRDVLYPVDQ